MTPSYALGRGIELRRTFDAPPEVVFDAWTDEGLLDWFFNPGMPVSEPISVDLRVGGAWRQHMVVNADTQYMTGGIYREIVPARKLVFTWGAVGGWPSLDPGNIDDAPLVTILFEPRGEQTEMIFRLQLADHLSEDKTREWLDMGMGEGWGMTIDRLVAQLRSEAA